MDVLCIICYESMKSTDIIYGTLCGHLFHSTCIDDWLGRANTCPQCRSRVMDGDIGRIYLTFSSSENSLMETIITSHQSELDNLQAQLLQKNLQIQETDERVTNLNRMLELRTTALNDLDDQLRQQHLVDDQQKDLIKNLNIQIEDVTNRFALQSAEVENSRRELEKSLGAAALEKDALSRRIVELEKVKFEWEPLFTMFPGTRDPAELRENIANMKREFQKSLSSATSEKDVLSRRIVELEKLKFEWESLFTIFPGTRDPAGLRENIANMKRELEKSLGSAASEKDALNERILELEKVKFEWEQLFTMFPDTRDPAGLRENVANMKSELESSKARCAELETRIENNIADSMQETILKQQLEKKVADFAKENIVMQERISKLEKMNKSADWVEVAQIFSDTDDSAAIIEKIAALKRELTSSTARCSKLKESTADFSKLFLEERAKNRDMEISLAACMSEKLELQARLEELSKNVKSEENTVLPKAEKNVPATKKTKAGAKLKGNTRASRAPLGAIDQNKENPPQSGRYNLRPR